MSLTVPVIPCVVRGVDEPGLHGARRSRGEKWTLYSDLQEERGGGQRQMETERVAKGTHEEKRQRKKAEEKPPPGAREPHTPNQASCTGGPQLPLPCRRSHWVLVEHDWQELVHGQHFWAAGQPGSLRALQGDHVGQGPVQW